MKMAGDEDAGPGIDLFKIFPITFTFASCFIFLMPFIKCWDVAFDVNVLHWMGMAPSIVIFVPVVLILIAHIVHSIKRAPSKGAVSLVLIGSCLTYGFLGYSVSLDALQLSGYFGSTDCSTLSQKYDLEQSWQAAKAFGESCRQNGTVGFMDSCPGYQDQVALNPSWPYLMTMEEQFQCGGWCTAGTALWAFNNNAEVREPCSFAVAEALKSKVERLAMEIVVYCVGVVALTAVGLVVIAPTLREKGIDW